MRPSPRSSKQRRASSTSPAIAQQYPCASACARVPSAARTCKRMQRRRGGTHGIELAAALQACNIFVRRRAVALIVTVVVNVVAHEPARHRTELLLLVAAATEALRRLLVSLCLHQLVAAADPVPRVALRVRCGRCAQVLDACGVRETAAAEHLEERHALVGIVKDDLQGDTVWVSKTDSTQIEKVSLCYHTAPGTRQRDVEELEVLAERLELGTLGDLAAQHLVAAVAEAAAEA